MPLGETRATPISPGSHTAFYRLFGMSAQPARGDRGTRKGLRDGPPPLAAARAGPATTRVHCVFTGPARFPGGFTGLICVMTP
ncbi:hypothetical protein GCM10012286_31290 [Streptomyces lasiicapitis]|uniref:Uncharacterized protein n=1 Tax=Streptomyces lasiicapitis TaxID=1923961 RepID=A0ABQ2LY73_9ACTN|nr:hypothetical protein GCM10012286_31290 [Streptomyces lasiicapitis]